MNNMKRLLLIFIMFIILSCNPKIITTDNTQYTNNMHNSLNTYYFQYEVDSMIRVDSLPQLTDWQVLYGKDYESKDIVNIYFYIKQDSINEVMYKLETINNDTIYKIIKRNSNK